MEISKIEQYFSILDSREREVIVYRYGLNDQDEMTQREIAKKLNISRSYVSRIEKERWWRYFMSITGMSILPCDCMIKKNPIYI